ncbi:MAG: SCO family protein [Novosphingobium sp.]|nr:SCO family protein [Novosphingobium sp.]
MSRLLRLLLPPALLLPAACSSGASEAPRPPLEGARIGGDFALVDKAGKTVRFGEFAGKYRVVYFGFTYCPDACPNDLQKLMLGFNRFAEAEPAVAARVQPIFVSIDPARDTPQVVGEFAAAFSPRLLGLTGSEAQVAEAAKMFAAYFTKGETRADGGYLMDHSRIAYLMDPQGKPLALLPIDQDAAAVAAELARWTS